MSDAPFTASDTLDESYAKTLESLMGQGLTVEEPTETDTALVSRDFGRLLRVPRENSSLAIYLSPYPWTEEWAATVAGDLISVFRDGLRTGKLTYFQILSPHPLTPDIEFLFGNSKAAQMELACAATYEFPAVVPPEEMPRIAAEVAPAVLRLFPGSEVAIDDEKGVESLERLILTEIRPEKDPGVPLPEQAVTPERLLLVLGALFGEMMGRISELEVRWVADEQSPHGVAMDVRHRETGLEASVNVVGKVRKVYLFGQENSIVALAEYLRTTLASRE